MFFISSETKQRASGKLLGMQSSPDLRHENTPHPKVIQLPTYCTQSFPTYKNIIISHSFPWTCCQGSRGYSIGNREMQQGEGGAGSPASVVPSRSPSGRESLNRLLYFLPCKWGADEVIAFCWIIISDILFIIITEPFHLQSDLQTIIN
jgi:hypothetical protein